eukprot:3519412-Rhodomonas_salina.2
MGAAWDSQAASLSAAGEIPVAQLALEGPVYYTSKRVPFKGTAFPGPANFNLSAWSFGYPQPGAPRQVTGTRGTNAPHSLSHHWQLVSFRHHIQGSGGMMRHGTRARGALAGVSRSSDRRATSGITAAAVPGY